ncbi:hypothetical protein BC936DRAFT_148476 [Jimgerdemannia flammicorona]|uniref:Uncharacterized protein n=1 Tax=Jimgerdemannia flammicorona TaxID=994334 RepID=A0A433D302_9FUNG|nr:hypothetical protein BC936DRAFT_148476 [Jimgerdemannia flammicorona]
MSQARIQHAVSLLTPFDQLPGRQQGRIGLFKDQFPHDDELTNHLTDMHLPVLVQYLVWIPFDNFAEVTRLGNESFSTVWKGTVETNVFALKEIDTSMFQEVDYIIYYVGSAYITFSVEILSNFILRDAGCPERGPHRPKPNLRLHGDHRPLVPRKHGQISHRHGIRPRR